ncbi:MAG: FAD-dependent oxidoreductase, partial [Thermoplasmatota archaeon]
MHRDFAALAAREFDVLVIGGGINGAGVAREAARRGLAVALVEKEDFGYGTTGRSTRLVHGGLRYLEHYEFGLVRESLAERERLFANAPHLVRPLRFLYPVYAGRTTRWKLRIGMALYDMLSYDRSVPRSRWLPRDAALAEEPGLSPTGLAGAFAFYDAQVSAVERLVVENAEDAARHGAIVVNHAEAIEFRLHNGRVVGARIRDNLTAAETDARAKVTLNM